MEQNYNGYNNNNYNSNNNYTGYQGQPQYIDPVPVQPARKSGKGRLAKVIALIAAVAVVGGGAGFGGAFLASNMIKTASPASTAAATDGGTITASYNLDDDKKSDDGGSKNGDVSTALAAITASETGDVSAATSRDTNVVPTGPNGTYTADELYEAVNDTIVFIKVYENQSYSSGYDYYDYYFGYGGGSREKETNSEPVYAGYGSGIVFTEDGYILTNAHIVDDGVKFVVEVNDYDDPDTKHEYEATVVGSDNSTDIAVLKIERDEPFRAAKIGNSDSLKVGQDICVIGNPGITAKILFDHTLTKGIVSGLDIECLADNGYSISLIQTDAAINFGNSGGGMFDMYGNVVGVVNSKIVVTNYEGLGFALTINEAKPIMEDLLNYGYVKSRPVLGVSTVELTEYRAQLYGAKLSKGLLITGLNEGAPVEKSGLKVADIVTKINGINVETISDVQAIIGKLRVGDKVTATVARENGLGGMDSVEIEIELTESSEN